MIEYGQPIVVTKDDRLAAYSSGKSTEKRNACNELLDEVTASLRGVGRYMSLFMLNVSHILFNTKGNYQCPRL